MTRSCPTRRQLLAAASAGLGVAALPACSSGGGQEPAQGGASPAGGGTGSPGTLVALDDVPVGGAVGIQGPDGPLIVARPAEDEAVAFSAICTHQGCTVAPDGEQLRCPCHGSVYEATTGENVSGPAPRPLPPVEVQVSGGQVSLAG